MHAISDLRRRVLSDTVSTSSDSVHGERRHWLSNGIYLHSHNDLSNNRSLRRCLHHYQPGTPYHDDASFHPALHCRRSKRLPEWSSLHSDHDLRRSLHYHPGTTSNSYPMHRRSSRLPNRLDLHAHSNVPTAWQLRRGLYHDVDANANIPGASLR